MCRLFFIISLCLYAASCPLMATSSEKTFLYEEGKSNLRKMQDITNISKPKTSVSDTEERKSALRIAKERLGLQKKVNTSRRK